MNKMDTPPPNSIPVDSLELIRNRLNQVYQSLRKLADQINYSNRNPKAKLPGYLTLHGQFQVLITQLQTIAAQLDANDDVLKATNAYPLPSFPTTQHEGLLTTLLRKKPLPEVNEWIDAALTESSTFKLPIQKDDEFAEWCHAKTKELEEAFNFEGFQTEQELAYAQSEEGQAAEAKKKADEKARESLEASIVNGPAMQPNQVMRFMTRGVSE